MPLEKDCPCIETVLSISLISVFNKSADSLEKNIHSMYNVLQVQWVVILISLSIA